MSIMSRQLGVLLLLAITLPFFVLKAPKASACPAAVFLDNFKPAVVGLRSQLKLFAKEEGVFIQLPLQIDPVDKDGRYRFFKDDKWKEERLQQLDRLMLSVDRFGTRIKTGEKLPCQSTISFELKELKGSRWAYLALCPSAKDFKPTPPVVFDSKQGFLESSSYFYKFNSDNYMLFKEIGFFKDKNKSIVAENSRLTIRSDVKNFFTLHFDSDDIESQLEETRIGPVGDLARLSFFLKVLFFRIKMSLTTDVAFYEDSGNIPMMIQLPVDAEEYLHAGSGILYSWEASQQLFTGKRSVGMPFLDVEATKKGHKSLAKLGASRCGKHLCYYRLSMEAEGRQLAMYFIIEKYMVKKGFFPQFVYNVSRFNEQMDWDEDIEEGEKRMGLYFEVSGLGKGGHPWDFWLTLGTKEKKAAACPSPLRIIRKVNFDPGK